MIAVGEVISSGSDFASGTADDMRTQATIAGIDAMSGLAHPLHFFCHGWRVGEGLSMGRVWEKRLSVKQVWN